MDRQRKNALESDTMGRTIINAETIKVIKSELEVPDADENTLEICNHNDLERLLHSLEQT